MSFIVRNNQLTLRSNTGPKQVRLALAFVLSVLIFAMSPAADCQPLNGGVDKTDLNGQESTQTLQGSVGAQGSSSQPLSGSLGQQTLQGSATAVQTRLSRPLAGGAESNPLTGGVAGTRSTPPIDFAKAFPSLDRDTAASPRLSGGSQSDIGIIGEISTLSAPHIVTRVFSPSPAQEAGMTVGDVLLSADGKEAMPHWIIGVPGTPVTIVWSHNGIIRTSVLIRREAGSVPMEAMYKQQYLQQVGGFMSQFGRGW